MPKKIIAEADDRKVYMWANSEQALDRVSARCLKHRQRDRKKILSLLHRYCSLGPRQLHEQQFKQVEGEIYELKPTDQIRWLGVKEERDFIVLLCLVKKTNRLSKKDRKQAQKNRKLYYEERD